jgi:hypothetical protein
MLGEQIADGTGQIRFFAKTTFIGDRALPQLRRSAVTLMVGSNPYG